MRRADVLAPERQALFIKKLRLCSQQMDFSEASDMRDKEIKRLNLLELMDYINNTKNVFNEQTFPEIIQMIAQNLFRGLAPNNSPPHAQYDPDEDEPVLEASWPHLQYVYEFLLRFVVSNETDPKVVKKYITQDFLVRLLDLFDSEDPRERDYLKTILHRIYGKFMPYRYAPAVAGPRTRTLVTPAPVGHSPATRTPRDSAARSSASRLTTSSSASSTRPSGITVAYVESRTLPSLVPFVRHALL